MSVQQDNSLLGRMHALGLTLIELQSWLEMPKTIPLTEAARAKLLSSVRDLAARVE